MFLQYPRHPSTLLSEMSVLSLDMHLSTSLVPSSIYSNITFQPDFYMITIFKRAISLWFSALLTPLILSSLFHGTCRLQHSKEHFFCFLSCSLMYSRSLDQYHKDQVHRRLSKNLFWKTLYINLVYSKV